MLPVARDDGKTCLPVRSPKKKTPHGGACRLNPDILRPAVLAVRKISLWLFTLPARFPWLGRLRRRSGRVQCQTPAGLVSLFLQQRPPLPVGSAGHRGQNRATHNNNRLKKGRIMRNHALCLLIGAAGLDRKSTRLNSSHVKISYAVF